MEHYIGHSLPASWSDANKGPWAFGDGSARLSADHATEYALVSENSSRPAGTQLQPPMQKQQQENSHVHHGLLHPLEEILDTSSVSAQCLQEAYGAALRGATAWAPGLLYEPYLLKESQGIAEPVVGGSSSASHDITPMSAPNVNRERPHCRQQANPPQSWCQSYINGPRSRSAAQEGQSARAGGSGEAAEDDTDVMQCQLPAFVPLLFGGANTGIAQTHEGSATVVSGTARPRVRARRGQATDPHSIAERLRRERIAERMKALQELVPNANKTDKASMLDEIIDYVKFLQLQVKVLSMSRLGGAGAVVSLIADFPAEGHNNLAAALGSVSPFNDEMAVAERQVARLMEKDMGSAMQFLQAKGLCLMPVSLATVISSNNSRMMAGGGGQQGFAAMDHSRIHAASSTSSTLASVASSGCIVGEGESKSKH